MARTNVPKPSATTHEGATAYTVTPYLTLRRSVMACMLWEDTFYESGTEIAQRIQTLIPAVEPAKVAELAIEAREQMKLRHVPLLLVRELARVNSQLVGNKISQLVTDTTARVIQRPDEITELLSLYAKTEGRTGTKVLNKVSRALLKGIAQAFTKFNAYQLAKWNRDGAIKLRDALFLCHAKPQSEEQAQLWKQLVDGTLPTPDTWEVELSGGKGANKKESWERLLMENKLGALALLRNLRNMAQAGVDIMLIRGALANMNVERVLPFRFISAAKYAPQLEPTLEQAMFKSLEGSDKLPGRTAIVVDNSGSMYGVGVSAKSELSRFDAAAALAILLREVCEDVSVVAFSTRAAVVPARRGFALRDAITKATDHAATNTAEGLELAAKHGYDRIIVVTDEQSHQAVGPPVPGTKGYFVNVATYQNGIGYGAWTHIDGWSEAIVAYIKEREREVG